MLWCGKESSETKELDQMWIYPTHKIKKAETRLAVRFRNISSVEHFSYNPEWVDLKCQWAKQEKEFQIDQIPAVKTHGSALSLSADDSITFPSEVLVELKELEWLGRLTLLMPCSKFDLMHDSPAQ